MNMANTVVEQIRQIKSDSNIDLKPNSVERYVQWRKDFRAQKDTEERERILRKTQKIQRMNFSTANRYNNAALEPVTF